jgi:hypothetical protein
MSPDFQHVLRTAELLLLELDRLDHRGPEFTIIHSFRIACDGAKCQAGEEVSRIVLGSRGKQTIVPLALATRLVFDYLARTRHLRQTATQIAAGMRLKDFYRDHALNSGEPLVRKICRTAVKEYVKRIREALAVTFQKVTLPLDPMRVLVSEATDGNEVHYHLQASIEWLHVDELAERYSHIRKSK